MRRLRRFGWAALVVLVGAGGPRLAQGIDSIEDRVSALEKEAKDTRKTLTEELGIAIHGLVAVDYLYDINRPGGGAQPALRVFEGKRDSFLLNQGNLHVERQPESGLGFVADLDFGETAKIVNNATFFGRTDSGGTDITGNGTDFFDARQFYLTYTVPVGSGIKLKAGRFVTLAGAEVIKAYNNLNYNVTQSILFGFSIPYTHTGLMASYAFNDLLSLDLCVVNGWDAVADNNDGKTVHSGLTIAPSPRFTIYITGTYGAEQTAHSVIDDLGNTLVIHPGKSKRLLLTTLITVKPTEQLTLILDHNYGRETEVVPRGGGLHTAEWHGLAGYIVYAFTDAISATLRAEVFNDMDGARVLGFPTGGSGLAATYYEVSPALTYKITDGLFWRSEYRHDESDTKKIFPRQDHFGRGQDTIATELVYTF